MNEQMILLHVEQGPDEGWEWMTLGDFMRRLRLDIWSAEEERMIGMILPGSPPPPSAKFVH